MVFTLQMSLGIVLVAGRGNLGGLARQPVLWATVVALVMIGMDWSLPVWLDNTTSLLGDLTIPLMLLTLGVSLADVKFVKRGWIVRSASGKLARSENRRKYIDSAYASTVTAAATAFRFDLSSGTDTLEELMEQLKTYIEQTLKIDSIDLEDNLFELGVDSLLFMKLFTDIEALKGVDLPLAELSHNPHAEVLLQPPMQVIDVLHPTFDVFIEAVDTAARVAEDDHLCEIPFPEEFLQDPLLFPLCDTDISVVERLRRDLVYIEPDMDR